jgi:hypothetical protein
MSQAGIINVAGGGGGGAPVETLTGNSGGAVPPTLNNINIVGSGGVTVTGNPGTSTLTISFSESGLTGTGTTIDNATADLITITPTDLKSFSIQGLVTGYDSANNVMIGGEIIANGRRNGTVTIVGTPDTSRDADAVLIAPNQGLFNIVSSGATFILRVTGVTGHTISWRGAINYIQSP